MGFRGQQETGLLRGHAERLGLCSEHWEFTEVFEARRLYDQFCVSKSWFRLPGREWTE